MARLDHIGLPVRDWKASRDWYVAVLGLTVENEIPNGKIVFLNDDHDLTVILAQGYAVPTPAGFGFWYQVENVEAFFAKRSGEGVHFVHPPQKTGWGYGVELADPDGYAVYVWDEKSMKENG